MKPILFTTLLFVLALVTSAQDKPKTITLSADQMRFYLEAWRNGLTKDTLLHSAQVREKSLLTVIEKKDSQINEFKGDSIRNVLEIENLELQKKNVTDSATVIINKQDVKIKKLTWAVIGEALLTVLIVVLVVAL